VFKITGLDKAMKDLDELSKALAALDGDLGSVNFNPQEPASIEAAIQAVEEMVDERTRPYQGNSTVASLAEEMKQRYREAIIEKAAEARLESDGADE
jgi:hypothetical protein